MNAPAATPSWIVAVIAVVIAAATLLIYAPAFHADFIDYDDPMYITENEWVQEGLTASTFKRAWTERVAGNWHPVTMLSHLVDVSLFGLDPRGHHATSLMLHTLNALLLFAVFRKLFGGLFRPALAAAIFALHPFNVDSAVWLAERKNLVSSFFWLSATWCYVRHAHAPSVPALLAAILLFALGLMSKPMLVTFPLTLLMLDLWPLRRVRGFSRADLSTWIRLLQEKTTLFMLTILFSVLTLITQFPQGYEHTPDPQPFWAKALFSLQHYQMYLEKFFWPSGFCVFYPRLELPPDYTAVATAGMLLIVVTAAVVWLFSRAPSLAIGWFWFVGTMFPVIGLIGIGQHSITDRYMYIPMIGLIIALVWLVADTARGWIKAVAGGLGLLFLMVCATVTRGMMPHWQNSEAVFRRAIEVTENNYIMMSNLGRQMIIQRRIPEGMSLFEQALAIHPKHVKSLNNLGFALAAENKHREAIPYYEQAIRLDPAYRTARINLARSLVQEKRYREALDHYEVLMKSDPGVAEVREGWRRCRQALGLPAGWMP